MSRDARAADDLDDALLGAGGGRPGRASPRARVLNGQIDLALSGRSSLSGTGLASHASGRQTTQSGTCRGSSSDLKSEAIVVGHGEAQRDRWR